MKAQNDKHTPGPWKAVEAIVENAPNRAMVAVSKWGGENVADCGDSSPATMANARLIAAAPELLEACQMLIGVAEWADRNNKRSIVGCCDWEKVRAAIRKAVGR